MGRHFDHLVEIVRKHLGAERRHDLERDARLHLISALPKAQLFEFPINSGEVFKTVGKETSDAYEEYLQTYFDLSRQEGRVLALPFRVTAIEDNDGVVVLQEDQQNFWATTYMPYEGQKHQLVVSVVTPQRPANNRMEVHIGNTYAAVFNAQYEFERHCLTPAAQRASREDLYDSVRAAIQENIWIMDPANWIVRVDTNQSLRQEKKRMRRRKGGGKKAKHDRPFISKTATRHTYLVVENDDLRDFLRGVATEPHPAHPVKGHDRRLTSERFRNMRGQVVRINQYFTGDACVTGKCGRYYTIYVKDGLRIGPYGGSTAGQHTFNERA